MAAMVIAFVWSREREPQYKGVTLTGWLCSYAPGADWRNHSVQKKEEAASAVRHIGTNAIPFLLEWMCYEPSPWRKSWRNAFEQLPDPLDRLGRLSDVTYGPKSQLRNRLALDGFEILGPDARSAIPELTRIMQNAKSHRLWFAAVQALENMGKEGLGPLILAIGEEAPGDWRHVVALIDAIGRMGQRGVDIAEAVPPLLENSGHTNLVVCHEAWRAVNTLSVERPWPCFPVLAESLRHSNEIVRAGAATLLVRSMAQFDPEALAEATNVLNVARPEVLKQIATARRD